MASLLYCGDNLDVMRHCLAEESIDLVYLDPPFKSDQDYNLLFREKSGQKSSSQILAFEDTWEWSHEAEKTVTTTIERGGKLGEIMSLFKAHLGDSDMLAYLAMMAPRLVELHRVLKPTGSIYLHCDPTASHYLKLLMDGVFGPGNFRSEIVWKRTFAHGGASRWGDVHDTIFFYTKSDRYTWNRVLQALDDSYIEDKYRWTDKRGRYSQIVMTGPGTTKGPSGQPWRGYDPTDVGRHWAVPKRAIDVIREEGFAIPEGLHDQLELLYTHGFIYIPQKSNGNNGVPRFKMYLPKGQPVQDVIVDVFPINSQARERLGYPTQKPISLLDRIIQASSNKGEMILDPFCGCGTAIEAAINTERNWIGIDLTIQAMRVIRDERLGRLGLKAPRDYRVIYRPADLNSAAAFAAEQPFAFQDWAVEMLGGVSTKARSGDRGIDGKLYFQDGSNSSLRQIVISVKGGKLKAPFVRELQGAVARERAAMGILVTLNEPSKSMRREMASGVYVCASGTYPKTQFVTVAQILSGSALDLPPICRMNEKKALVMSVAAEQLALPGVV